MPQLSSPRQQASCSWTYGEFEAPSAICMRDTRMTAACFKHLWDEHKLKEQLRQQEHRASAVE